MFCNYCGKQIEDGSKFCPYCGKQMLRAESKDQQSFNSEGKTPYSIDTGGRDKVGFSAVDVIIIALNVIICIRWINVFQLNYEYTKEAFKMIDKFSWGITFYWIPFIIAMAFVVSAIIFQIKRNYYIFTGIGLTLLSVVLKIGAFIYDEITFDYDRLIYYRVFLVYKGVTTLTIILGVLITILLYYKKLLGEK